MKKPVSDTVVPALRAWLHNERRLGVTHCGAASAPAAGAASAPAPADLVRPATRSHPAQHTAPVRAATTPSLLADDPALPALCTQDLSADAALAALAALNEQYVRGCQKCPLHAHRTQTVFGVGHPRPRLVFVGEGPGADEDAQGEPFVGRAGQLLTRMIAAMTLTRDQVYICNVVKCRPPGNRTPTDDEMHTCGPYLYRQLAILRPQVIVTLGRPATQTLLVTKTTIGQLRGQWHDFPPPALAHLGLPPTRLMPTFHPAYLLRSPGEKAKAWDDLQQVMMFLGIPIPKRA